MFSYSSKNWLRLSSFRDFEKALNLEDILFTTIWAYAMIKQV